MNTEHYKAASEATDADERALIPAIRRRAFIAKHGVTGGTLESRTETGKAHKTDHQLNVALSNAWESELAKARAKAAHADKLAENLSLLIRTVNDTLRHGLTDSQVECLEDCVKYSNGALEDWRESK